jgi:hypothetical protein
VLAFEEHVLFTGRNRLTQTIYEKEVGLMHYIFGCILLPELSAKKSLWAVVTNLYIVYKSDRYYI